MGSSINNYRAEANNMVSAHIYKSLMTVLGGNSPLLALKKKVLRKAIRQ
jgi:hypothetical protein